MGKQAVTCAPSHHPPHRHQPPLPSLLQIRALDSHKLVAAAGPQADVTQFVEYTQKNIVLYEFRNGARLSTRAAANYVRSELAYALRTNPYQVNLLLGGWDAVSGAELYFMDYLGSSTKTNFSAHGYAGYFLLSTMDRYWRPDMNLEDALALARMCIKELQTRFLMNQPRFKIKVADKDGTREVELN